MSLSALANPRLRLIALLAAVLLPSVAGAQNISGTILGVVSDPSGTAVTDARVVVANIDTNQANEVLTDSAGRYELPYLRTPALRTLSIAPGASEQCVKARNRLRLKRRSVVSEVVPHPNASPRASVRRQLASEVFRSRGISDRLRLRRIGRCSSFG